MLCCHSNNIEQESRVEHKKVTQLYGHVIHIKHIKMVQRE